MKVGVISADKDGAELRRLKTRLPMSTRATGTHDEEVIMEADKRACKGATWSFPADAYERIFKKA
jgi:hypothetical protein